MGTLPQNRRWEPYQSGGSRNNNNYCGRGRDGDGQQYRDSRDNWDQEPYQQEWDYDNWLRDCVKGYKAQQVHG
jgi:hypothetical protein